MQSLANVLNVFRSEFSLLLGKFAVHVLAMDRLSTTDDESITKPGVYVFWKKDRGVINVGKSLANAKEGALQQAGVIAKDDRVELRDIERDADCHVVLITITQDSDVHWLLSLEFYLESKLGPVIQSGHDG